ncbi:hypothetical protein [Paraburkholderia ginsengiterrae]|uniref:hypothetical protein n=1 Tax=Paraburkholderia ginsengiterrae TaxID=1462993 RepID=UPI0012FBF1F8|nr:hypothetical protein [Paraburkholderia ginsengiterrae]
MRKGLHASCAEQIVIARGVAAISFVSCTKERLKRTRPIIVTRSRRSRLRRDPLRLNCPRRDRLRSNHPRPNYLSLNRPHPNFLRPNRLHPRPNHLRRERLQFGLEPFAVKQNPLKVHRGDRTKRTKRTTPATPAQHCQLQFPEQAVTMIARHHRTKAPVASATWVGKSRAHAARLPSRAVPNGGDSVWRHGLLDQALV